MVDTICIDVFAFEEDEKLYESFVKQMNDHNEGKIFLDRISQGTVRICGDEKALANFAQRAYMSKVHVESVVARLKEKLGDSMNWVEELTEGYGVFSNM